MTNTTPDLTTPAGILASAAADVAEAEARLTELNDRTREGDETITFEDIESAERQTRWARIRREAAQKKAVKKAEELRRERFNEVIEATLPIVQDGRDEVIEELLAKARPLVEKAIELNNERNRAIVQLAKTLTGDPELTGDDPRFGYRTRYNPNAPAFASVDIDGTVIDTRQPADLVTMLANGLTRGR